MTYTSRWEPHGLLIQYRGRISIVDIVAATTSFQKDDRFEHLRYVIADYTAIDCCDTSPRDIEDVLVADIGSMYGNGRIREAVVATCPSVLAMIDHYRSFAGMGYPLETFSTIADARAWLTQ